MRKIISYFKDESGASAAEYALILGLIAAAIVLALNGLSGAITAAIGRATAAING